MTAEELQTWRAGSGYSIFTLAEILRVEPNVVEEWETGQKPIPQWLPQALDEMSEHPRSASPVCYMTSLDWIKREQ